MTGGPEDPARDPALARAWREHSQETPPPELDRAILAAAHRAAGSAPQDTRASATAKAAATRPQRWWMPLAAAATIGAVVIGMLQVAPLDQDEPAPIAEVARPPRSSAPILADETKARVETRSAPDAGAATGAAGMAERERAPASPSPKQEAGRGQDARQAAAAAPASMPAKEEPVATPAPPAMAETPAVAKEPAAAKKRVAERFAVTEKRAAATTKTEDATPAPVESRLSEKDAVTPPPLRRAQGHRSPSRFLLPPPPPNRTSPSADGKPPTKPRFRPGRKLPQAAGCNPARRR